MIKDFSRRHFLSLLAASTAMPALAKAPQSSIRPKARASDYEKQLLPGSEVLIDKAALGGKVSFAVADARSGRILESRNGGLGQPPASVTKSITAAYALHHLGSAHRFTTRVLATKGVQNGVVQGDLILAGGGDPTLDTDALGDLAAGVKAAGIREVKGKFRVYTGALPFVRKIDGDQLDHVGYNPCVSGMNLNYNRVHFEWRRASNGYKITMDARAKRFVPHVQSARMKVVERTLPVYTYKSARGVDHWTVARRALGKGGARWLPVRNPGVYAGEVFQGLLRAHGIVVKSAQEIRGLPTASTVLAQHQSPPLAELVRVMLKFSTNLTAEVLGLAASQVAAPNAGSLSASARAMSSWAKSHLGMKSARFVDHSGLGENSRVSADDLVRALVALGAGGQLAGLLKPIPLKGADGKTLKNHPVKVHAKTGTLNFVSALSGFVAAPGGTEMAFAILTSDLPRRRAAKKAGDEVPSGSRGWNRRSRTLQHQLIHRWSGLYGA